MDIFLVICSTILFLYFHFVITEYIQHRKFNYIQETSIAITLGAVVGVFAYFFGDVYQSQVLNGENMRALIFLALLPPIMFEDGYNFPKRKFFQNIFYINLYGLFGTFLHFFTMYAVLTLANQAGWFVSVSDVTESITLSNWQILLTAACLSSIEPIVSEKVVNKERYPKMFSIIFGESLFKDTISITLFDSCVHIIGKFSDQNIQVNSQDILGILLQFLLVVVCSLLIGFATGIVTTVVFKHWRFLLVEKGISEVALTLLTGYLGYIISEWLQFSGVISMLFCGTVLSHFNVYNLTEQGKQTTKITLAALKTASCGLIFFLIGFYIFNVQTFQSEKDQAQKSAFSVSMLGITFAAMFLGRAFNIFLMSLLGYLIIGRDKWRLNTYEYLILYSSGLIKGAVPFALIITIPYSHSSQSNTTQTNVIMVVFITSLFFNSILPKVQRTLLKRIVLMRKEQPDHPSLKDSILLRSDFLRGSAAPRTPNLKSKPTAEEPKRLFGKFKSTTQKYWRKFEEGLLKPQLIFDYYQRKEQIKMDKMKRRRQEYEDYLRQKGEDLDQNILSLDNEQSNKFIDLKLSASDSDSDDEPEEGVIKKKIAPRRPTEQEITNISAHPEDPTQKQTTRKTSEAIEKPKTYTSPDVLMGA